MKKLRLRLLFVLLLNVLFIHIVYAEIYPYLTQKGDSTNSIVVNWLNDTATGDSSVEFGTTTSYGSTVSNSSVTNYHHIELTGLTPNTTYHYKIHSSDGTVGQDCTFKTAKSNAAQFMFAAYGDTRGNDDTPDQNPGIYARHKAECDHIISKNPDFVLHVGDLVDKGWKLEEWVPSFFEPEANLLKRVPIQFALGSHEVQTVSGTPHYHYFDLFQSVHPSNGPSGCFGSVYSFDYGNAHFAILNSLYNKNYSFDLTTQATWLASDLAAARANPKILWIFLAMHEPFYTGKDQYLNTYARDAWSSIIDANNVDIVFAGHAHIYERTYKIKNKQKSNDDTGTYYVTSGLGGGPYTTFDPASQCASLIQTYYENKTLAAYVYIDGAVLNMKAINIDNQTKDEITIDKTPLSVYCFELYN